MKSVTGGIAVEVVLQACDAVLLYNNPCDITIIPADYLFKLP
jgi:hypothetical protein